MGGGNDGSDDGDGSIGGVEAGVLHPINIAINNIKMINF